MLKAIVYVRGGVVQHVDVPQGVEVEVRDYDLEPEDVREELHKQDSDGYWYHSGIWTYDG